MKVVLNATMCGPKGNGYAGSVIEVPQKEAEQMLSDNQARAFDPAKDGNKTVGLVRAEK